MAGNEKYSAKVIYDLRKEVKEHGSHTAYYDASE